MICPSCGKDNYGDASRCYNCGTDFYACQQGPADQQFQTVLTGAPYVEEKKGLPAWAIVLIVVGVLVVLAVPIMAGVLYMWTISMADTEGDVSIMSFEVRDGVNRDAEHGCFFTIRAVKSVDIDPSKYSFYVTETGRSPKKLDFAFRNYEDQGEDDLTPVGGDRNKSYRYDNKNWKIEGMNEEATGSSWSDGEYIGFDMPMAGMGITITKGTVYEVMIKDPNAQIVFTDTFVYQQQLTS